MTDIATLPMFTNVPAVERLEMARQAAKSLGLVPPPLMR